MKFKQKDKMQNAEQKPFNKHAQASKNSSWEMSAQDALRVDYVNRKRSIPMS